MLKEYVLWYKLSTKGSPKFAGVSRDYYSAEKIAPQLHFSLSLKKVAIYEIGITKIVLNKCYFDIGEVGESWVVYKEGAWFLDK